MNNPGGKVLLSRVANACYWLSRYQERAEFTARVIDVNLLSALEMHFGMESVEPDWSPILQINGCFHLFGEGGLAFTLPNVLHTLCLSNTNSNAIAVCIRQARENARQAREQISSEMWEQINDMYHMIQQTDDTALVSSPHEILQAIKNGSLLMQGLTDQTMMHGEGWHFIQLGRYIERANTTCRLLSARIDPRYASDEVYRNAVYWIGVLKSASSLEAYHKTYAAPVMSDLAIEFLMVDEDLPRSLLYCVENVLHSLTVVSGHAGRRFGSEAERLAGQLSSQLHYVQLSEIKLLGFLEAIQHNLFEISDFITQTYFAYEVA
jgi:uncharacterized alpha-E superfamily protein